MKIQNIPVPLGTSNVPVPGDKLIRMWAEQPVSLYYLYNGDESAKLRLVAAANSFEAPFPYPVDRGDLMQVVNTTPGNVLHIAYE